ncbi:MAG: polysaccharide deacetylase family protein [Candidatus Methanoperedens sp.]|nr:polysaccharide deacetylase family protein [Candidatus Methanoperedens sp.]
MVGVRVDIDTVRDAMMLPTTLELLENHGIRASFFVTTGLDETYRNFRHYLNPLKLISGNTLRRYGFSMFSGLLARKDVQSSRELNMILDHGHELGLHGYNHYEWMNNLDNKSREEISGWISKGCELFEKAFGYYPECFAAPGFRTNAVFLEVLDGFGFRYSSDFMGVKPFYPDLNGMKLRTRQVPVSKQPAAMLSSIFIHLLSHYFVKVLWKMHCVVFQAQFPWESRFEDSSDI